MSIRLVSDITKEIIAKAILNFPLFFRNLKYSTVSTIKNIRSAGIKPMVSLAPSGKFMLKRVE